MTRYLVTDTDIEYAINDAIDAQNKDRQGNNYVISNSLDVVNHVLRLLDKSKVTESEQTEKPKQDAGRETEPCKEQVRAATVALSEHMHEWAIDHGFDREVDNGFTCSCGVSGYSYKGLWAHLARVCLNAAREAVM